MNKKRKGASNVAILPKCDHSTTLLIGYRALLGYRKTTVSYSFSDPRGTLVNLELLRKVTQMSSYLDSNFRPHVVKFYSTCKCTNRTEV